MEKEDARHPMPRDERGWNVAPAPDGRGMPEGEKPRPPHRTRSFLVFVVVLFAVNLAAALLLRPGGGEPRVSVPFNPYFLQQVQAGHVKSITARDDAIQGTFTTKTRFPASDRSATPTTLFKTQVPSFWSHARLSALLQSKGVQVEAKSASKGSLLVSLLLGFGPALLIIGLFVLLARRAAAGGGLGPLANFGRCTPSQKDEEPDDQQGRPKTQQ